MYLIAFDINLNVVVILRKFTTFFLWFSSLIVWDIIPTGHLINPLYFLFSTPFAYVQSENHLLPGIGGGY